jgi:hypothetical protein
MQVSVGVLPADTLRRCLPGRIRRALDELPGTLDATYERTLLDIDEHNWVCAPSFPMHYSRFSVSSRGRARGIPRIRFR